MSSDYCQLHLTCKNSEEATKIANVLLSKKLVACAKQIPVNSSFRWQGKIQNTEEVLLVLQSRLALFDKIEEEITKHHSYDTFVLEAVSVAKISKDVQEWLDKEIHG